MNGPSPDMASIWANFGTALHHFVRARVSNAADAEDIVQDIFVKVQQRGDQLRDQERVAGWLFRIASNAITDHHRRRTSEALGLAKASTETAILGPSTATETEPGSEDCLAQCVRPFLEALDGHYREALELVDLEGLTHSEAAEIAGLSASGMKSRVQRGRAQLRGVLEECCHIDTDRRGGIIDYTPRNTGCCEG